MAFSCEKIFHGSPSGLDNTIILHGSTLEFTKSSDGNNALKWITTCPIRIMIVNTKVSRNTRLLVNGVTKLMKNHPEVVGNVFNAIEHISKSAVNTLDKLNNPNEKEKSEKYFEVRFYVFYQYSKKI